VVCNVSSPGVNFGSYDTFSNLSLDSTGNVSVICDGIIPYSISLSPGGGSYVSRAMASGGHSLNYNLYTDSTRASVWGDGTASTATINSSGTTANHTVYGRIPARQNAYVGIYSDTITITLTF
jgi:spore coat protein U-like protein